MYNWVFFFFLLTGLNIKLDQVLVVLLHLNIFLQNYPLGFTQYTTGMK